MDFGLYSEPDFENCSKADKSKKCGYHDYILIKGMPRKRGGGPSRSIRAHPPKYVYTI